MAFVFQVYNRLRMSKCRLCGYRS